MGVATHPFDPERTACTRVACYRVAATQVLFYSRGAREVELRATLDEPFVQQSDTMHAASSDLMVCQATPIRSRGSMRVDPILLFLQALSRQIGGIGQVWQLHGRQEQNYANLMCGRDRIDRVVRTRGSSNV